MRLLQLAAAVLLATAAVSCSKPAVYYPLYHYVGLSTSLASATNGKVEVYLNWGDRLSGTGKTWVQTNNASNFSRWIEVKSSVDGSTGWVDRSKVVSNVISRAVVLAPAVAYSTPTVSARNMQSVNPPLLCYVIDSKDADWVKVLPYQSQSYSLTNITWLPSDLAWLQTKDISSNASDVDVMVSVQFRTRQYKEAKISFEQNPNDAAQKARYETKLSELKTALEALVRQYPQSGAIKYANELLDTMFPPSVQTEGDTNGGTASGGNEAL